MVVRVPGVDSADPRLPQGVIDATEGTTTLDLAPGVHSHTNLVASSTSGDGPPMRTAAVYSGNGFAALAVKDPNTFYVVTPPGGGQGSLYLGNTLLVGVALSVPGAPGTVTATPGDTTVSISWATPSSSGGLVISGYTVQRSTNSTTGFADIATVSAATHNVTSTSLTNGTTYYFRVKATNAMGDSPWSTVVSAIPVTTSSTALASSDDSADAGTPVTFTATVTGGGGAVTTGTVAFKRDGNTMLAGVPVNSSGIATYTTSAIPIGSFTITAVYDGGSSFLPSTSNPVTQVMNFAGGPAPTTAALVSSDASSAIGQPVTFTVTVTRTSDGLPVTSGSVVFKDGSTTISTTVAVNATTGVATFTTSILSEASHNITAVYSGAPFYENSTSNTVVQVVAAAGGSSPIAQTLYSSKPTALVGEIVTLRTTVKSGTSPVTFGTVVFKDNGTVLGTGVALNIFGESTFTTDALVAGSHTITAEYTGAPTYEDDTSSITQTVVTSLTAPSPSDWASAFNSGSLTTITAWYHYNTGVLAQGFDISTLWNPAGAGSIANVTINDAWLTANAAAGKVVDDGGGHWTITGLKTSNLTIARSHLTFNHCYVYRADYEHIWGGGLNVFNNVDSNHTDYFDLVFNYCTVTTDGTSSDSSFGDAITYSPIAPIANAFTCNYCEITEWRAGFLSFYGVTANYCWVHDLNLFGADPHNTSGSIRGRQCRFNRNLFCDGTSSDVSLYADTDPYTDFWITENVMWVLPTHASQEVNFPLRGTGWSPLLPGYVREFTGNKLEKGLGGDNQYWSKISGNTLITGEPIFGGADTVQIPNVPTCLAGPSTGQQFGASPTLVSYHYTPSPSSTLFTFLGIGRAGTTQVPSVSFSDESGALWSAVPNTETPIEPAPANTTQYGLSASLWKQETSSSTQAFRRVTIDPYASSSVAYMAAVIIEVTGITGMTLVQTPVMSAVGRSVPFGGTVPSLASGNLANPCTLGNIVMFFVAFNHEQPGGLSVPAGWHPLGNNLDIRTSAACLWRNDFTGQNVTIPGFPAETGVVVTVLCEFSH